MSTPRDPRSRFDSAASLRFSGLAMGAAGIVFFLTEANRGIGIAFVVIGVVFVGTSFAIARKARSDARADDQVPPKPPAAEAPPAEASTPEPPAPR